MAILLLINYHMKRPVKVCVVQELKHCVKIITSKWWVNRENETGDWCGVQSYRWGEDDLAKSHWGITNLSNRNHFNRRKSHYKTSPSTEHLYKILCLHPTFLHCLIFFVLLCSQNYFTIKINAGNDWHLSWCSLGPGLLC